MTTARRHWPTALVLSFTARQDGACGRGRNGGCGETLLRPVDDEGEYEGIEIDHIIRLEDGGADVPGNIQLLHESCHRRKTSAEAGD